VTIFSPSRLVQKITCFCNLLGTGAVGVMFDPTAEGVVIHASLRKPVGGDPNAPPVALAFDYAFKMVTEIPEIIVDETGIRAVLSVRGMKEETFLPWHSVFAFLIGGVTAGLGVIQVDEQPKHLRTKPGEGLAQVDRSGAPVDAPMPVPTSKGGSA
jgi:hypothetical protein